jgi:hypothetical protein
VQYVAGELDLPALDSPQATAVVNEDFAGTPEEHGD